MAELVYLPAQAGAHYMYHVYIIKSISHNYYYIGFSKDPKIRLVAHNNGKTRSTKYYKPFKLVYTKEFDTRNEARDFERYLKIRSNKEKLLKFLS